MKIFHSTKPKPHKTSLLFLIPVLVCAGLVFSTDVSAASCSGVETSILECEGGGDSGIYHILSSILDTMTIGIGILAVLGIIIVGIQYLTAGGDTARTTKAKRRLLEIVVGVICYVLLYGFLSWLTPGGNISTDPGDMSDANINEVSISYSGKTYVGHTFVPKVTFNKDATNKTYSLKSNATGTVTTSGRGAKCVHTGKASIEVIAANGQRATLVVNCQEEPSEAADAGGGGDGVITTGSQANIKLNGNPNMRKETWSIINDHRRDFYYNNYGEVIHGYNSYRKYVKSLGGIFTQYASRTNKAGKIKRIKVKTAADLQAAAEYVYGLWTIWGPDYINGYAGSHRWRKDQPWKGGRNDGFYHGLSGRSSILGYIDPDINTLLSSGPNRIRTGCNPSVNTFYKSTSLKNIGGAALHTDRQISMSKVGKITSTKKLQVGDIVHFFQSGSWRHVALVGEVYKDYVVLYDGGGRFMDSGSFKKTMKRSTNSLAGTTYSYYSSWWAFRPWDIDQNITLKGIN